MLTMEEALKQSSLRFAAGEIVKGTIIEVRPKEVLVDIGYKSEGVIAAKTPYSWAICCQSVWAASGASAWRAAIDACT